MKEKIEAVIYNLKDLFKDKDRLVGIDDWDTMIGILMILEQVKEELQTLQLQRNTPSEEEVNDNGR